MNTMLTEEGTFSDAHPLLPTRQQVAGFGFYLYLLSDGILFASLFAAFAVLRGATDGGPQIQSLFELKNAYIETVALLTSSFTCGMAMIAADRRRRIKAQLLFLATVLLGLAFLNIEVHELFKLSASGATFSSSAAMTAFFTLVGTHGLHVTVGLIWLLISMAQIHFKGITDGVFRRLICFSLFWHVLDIVWIAVFTFVYLVGAAP